MGAKRNRGLGTWTTAELRRILPDISRWSCGFCPLRWHESPSPEACVRVPLAQGNTTQLLGVSHMGVGDALVVLAHPVLVEDSLGLLKTTSTEPGRSIGGSSLRFDAREQTATENVNHHPRQVLVPAVAQDGDELDRALGVRA